MPNSNPTWKKAGLHSKLITKNLHIRSAHSPYFLESDFDVIAVFDYAKKKKKKKKKKKNTYGGDTI